MGTEAKIGGSVLSDALRDGEIDTGEAANIVRDYKRVWGETDRELARILGEHGHDIGDCGGASPWSVEHYKNNKVSVSTKPVRPEKKRETKLVEKKKRILKITNNPIKRKKLIWLSIVGPSALVSLLGLLV